MIALLIVSMSRIIIVARYSRYFSDETDMIRSLDKEAACMYRPCQRLNLVRHNPVTNLAPNSRLTYTLNIYI